MSQMIDQAKKYIDSGLSIIPLKPRLKEPMIPWEKFSTTPPSHVDAERWFTKPDLNIGIVTGAVSKLVVVDIDSEEGFTHAREHNLVSPVAVLTGKGRHYYFQHPGTPVQNKVRLFPGVDIRADGGYVMAPPSTHENGKKYSWIVGSFNRDRLPLFVQPTVPLQNNSVVSGAGVGWIAEAFKSLTKGNRNDTFTRIVGRLFRDHWTSEDIYLLLASHAQACSFPETELRTIIESVARYNRPTAQSHGEVKVLDSVPLRVRAFSDSHDEYEERIKERTGKIQFPTGYVNLDGLTRGLHRQELLTVAARTGVGKTNWAIGTSKSMCRQGRRVLYFSSEMPWDTIWERYIALTGTDQSYKQEQFYVCDDFTPDIGRIEGAIAELKPDIFIFDHINHMGEEHKVLSQFMKDLHIVSRKFDMPGIVLAQLNRQADWVDQKTGAKVIPRLSMIKGSGTIEEESAQVLLLSEIAATEDQVEIVGNLDKNRYGKKGILSFALQSSPYRMVELEG